MTDLTVRAIQATMCVHTLGILVAMSAGFFAAAKAKKAGIPPLGPVVIAVGVALLGAVALVFTFVEMFLLEALAGLPFQLLAFGALSMDAFGTLLVLAGLVLTKRPPPSARAAEVPS